MRGQEPRAAGDGANTAMDDGSQLKGAVRRPRAPRPTPEKPTVDPQVAAVVAARHGDPFAFLGMHEAGDGLVVRAMLPGAAEVAVVDARRGIVVAEAESAHPDGFFVAAIPDRNERFPYRLRARWGDDIHEFDDVYRFLPVLRRSRRAFVGRRAAPRQLHRKLGAHVTTMEGVDGVAFAVWAPENAQRVSCRRRF